MSKVVKLAVAIGFLSVAGVSAHAAETVNGKNLNGLSLNGKNLNGLSLNGKNLNGKNLNGSNLNGSNLNGLSLNGISSERPFLGVHVSALIAPDGTLVTLD